MTSAVPSGRFSLPKPGASLLLSFSFRIQKSSSPAPFLILGSGPLAAQRAFSALEAEASVVVIGQGGPETACGEIRWRVSNGQIGWVDLGVQRTTSSDTASDTDSEDALLLEKYLSTAPSPKFLCVTDTLISSATRRSRASAAAIYELCRSRNINVNTTDYPDLCDFSFATTYRFSDSPESSSSSSQPSNTGGALQVAITTNGQGCRLAGRIKREIITRLPKDVGRAVKNVGRLRALAKERDMQYDIAASSVTTEQEDLDPCADTDAPTTPNLPVPQRPSRTSSSKEVVQEGPESVAERAWRRMKWVAQISEYWPFEKLAGMTEEEMRRCLEDESAVETDPAMAAEESLSLPQPQPPLLPTSIHSLLPSPSSFSKPGQILLIGSGPGHPSLPSLATPISTTIVRARSYFGISSVLPPFPTGVVIRKEVAAPR